ncbi:hypothetical protein [Petroclostridium sp. X23]|jgi:hypothetical protein|uniref:hypothetical protein n=1 Tax=Petroclostridium sp. X23 TaxID=3045146 RepID=UPI0024ADEB07|nr:hypothetical protein [Petroclostridium sp. X23]WHH58596.1 hypothetical protein QKW49_22835 [Petroclostridium sp. X23]
MKKEIKEINILKNEMLKDDELDKVSGGTNSFDADQQLASLKPRPPKPSPDMKFE